MVFITKDIDGTVGAVEIDNKHDARFTSFTWMLQGTMGLLSEEDIDQLARDLPPDTSALVLLFEHRWAVNVKRAIMAAGGLRGRQGQGPRTLDPRPPRSAGLGPQDDSPRGPPAGGRLSFS